MANKKNNEENNNESDKVFRKVVLSWYPGHMYKTKKQMLDDLKLIDIVIEVTDARIPYSSRNPDIENIVKDKKKIIILNKKDLADENYTNEWIKYYKKQDVVAIPVDSSKKIGTKDVIDAIKNVGSDTFKKFNDKGRIGRKIKVMIFGIPNVGKSTFINMLANKNSAKAENRPGVTQKKQWIRLSDDIELMDTPGMLWPKIENNDVAMNLAFTNSIGKNAFDNEEIAFYLLKYLCSNYKEKVEKRYDIKIEYDLIENEAVSEIMNKIAVKKGCILKGNQVNLEKVSNMILNDFQSGKIGRISLEKPQN